MTKNIELLEKIIVGYVPHRIYAFSTSKIIDYLKVGETSRNINVRLNEWKKVVPDLRLEKYWLASLPKDGENPKDFFRDYALHRYFKEHGFQPKKSFEAPGSSKEFYPVTINDVEKGIDTINVDFGSEPPRHYSYLSIEDNSCVIEHYIRTENFKPRENQRKVINNIVEVSKDKNVNKNYLLFAVMRFGKTFVSLEAAKGLKSKLTVVVSAKADVKSEWQKNLESHKDFEGYVFLTSDSLMKSDTAIEDELNRGNKIVLFLTLQDLKGRDTKNKHKQLFNKQIDLLIIDESHFGARAQSYGQVIQKVKTDGNLTSVDAYEEQYQTDDVDDKEEVKALANVKSINAEYTLHLSGTPYQILMGNEFSNPKQIVGKVQFEDILEAKEKWFQDNLNEPEWKNPYFGFPQMVRFAFDCSEDAEQKIAELASEEKKSQLNELFGPMFNDKIKVDPSKFKHESYVLNTLKALDGGELSDNISPILDYEKIKEGKMAQHIVMVLPYKASCDAMSYLLQSNKLEFKHLCDYEIINIAGHDTPFNNRGNISALDKIKIK
ncbi:DEAD/DEAH box helicase family protein [Leuconostoc gelidum]|uniref:DEAD/DEAH box helicase family protein n=1 Tax=Leuconostoc gelidum TaxID=1244 RepID=UPI00226E94C9|nr:DEAD/DEAH box helicase family protein [Leuconostoc gelidum]